jgi:hypothetical protein
MTSPARRRRRLVRPPRLRLITADLPPRFAPRRYAREPLVVAERVWRWPTSSRAFLFSRVGGPHASNGLVRLGVIQGGPPRARPGPEQLAAVRWLARRRNEARAAREEDLPLPSREVRTIAEAILLLRRRSTSFTEKVGCYYWDVFRVRGRDRKLEGGPIGEPGWYYATKTWDAPWRLAIPVGPYASLRLLLLHAVPAWLRTRRPG